MGDAQILTMLNLDAVQDLIYYAVRTPPGVLVEVGVYRGGSAFCLAQLGRPLFLYDTFEGLPYQGAQDGNPTGRFADTSVEEVQALVPDATIIKGLFPDSLVPMPPVSFVHCDVDQYQSTRAVLERLPPLMVPGGIILVDDYGVADCEGATQAVQESGFPFLISARTGKAIIII
jgi:cephalosporin hydroxylase